MKRICAHCKSHFRPSKYHRHQHYCNKEECQKARKALWQKNKIQKDPSYYSEYRKNHQEYTAKNRKKSRERYKKNLKYHARISPDLKPKEDFAKMDLASLQLPVKSGRYKLMPFGVEDFAKMDAAIVQIIVIEEVTKNEEFLQI